MPVGNEEVLRFTDLTINVDQNIPVVGDNTLTTYYSFEPKNAYNFFKDDVLPTAPAFWNRLYGITVELDRKPKILNIDATTPWTMVRVPNKKRFTPRMFWPILYLEQATNSLTSILPAEIKPTLKTYLEGFESVFSGNAFPLVWTFDSSAIVATQKRQKKNFTRTASRIEFGKYDMVVSEWRALGDSKE
jgi:hypothetical protein